MIVFLTEIDPQWKTGLYNAVVSRARYYSNCKIINISYYDSFSLALLKKIFNKKIKLRSSEKFDTGLSAKNVYIGIGLIRFFLSKLIPEFYFKSDAKKIKHLLNKNCNLTCHWGVTAGIVGYFLKENVNSYSVFFHGSDIHTIPKESDKIHKLVLLSMHNSKMNFFVSKALLNSAVELGFTGKNCTVSYNAVDVKKFKNDTKEKSKCVAYIGNLFHVKGADYIPDIFLAINKKDSDVNFLIVGDGYLRNDIFEKLKVIKDKVTFLGKVEPDTIPNVMNVASLVIIPSRQEALSLVAIESLAAGCNIVAADVGGLREFVEKRYLIQHGDTFIKNFSSVALELLSNPVKQNLPSLFNADENYLREQDIINS